MQIKHFKPMYNIGTVLLLEPSFVTSHWDRHLGMRSHLKYLSQKLF